MLFQWGKFKSAAGLVLDWKIECDALTDSDWDCIARACLPLVLPFGDVVGIPRGGLKFAAAMEQHIDPQANTVLFVDDVWTTGLSMMSQALEMGLKQHEWQGLVAFSRSVRLPPFVNCFAEIKVSDLSKPIRS